MDLLFIPLTIGLPAIDESLEKLLTAMETFPNVAVLGDAVSMAKALGLCLALCVGSYECWMMMLGRRGMDVMKLLRIIGISLCISSSSWICSALQVPGKSLESATWAMAKAKNKEVAAFELKVAQKQSEYLDRLRTVQDSIATAKQVAEIGQDAAWWDKLIYNVENLGSTINNYAQRAAVAAETKVSEWINDVIRFVGELIFQMSYYDARGTEDFHGHHDDILSDHVCPLAGTAMELGLEPVDVQVPFPLIMGIRDLYVYLLYRLHPSL